MGNIGIDFRVLNDGEGRVTEADNTDGLIGSVLVDDDLGDMDQAVIDAVGA